MRVVVPSANKPASSTQDFTWAEATGGAYSMPRNEPPAIRTGAPPFGPSSSTRAPIRSKGSWMRRIGRARNEASPVISEVKGCPARIPASSLRPVPEFPRSSGPAGARHRGPAP